MKLFLTSDKQLESACLKVISIIQLTFSKSQQRLRNVSNRQRTSHSRIQVALLSVLINHVPHHTIPALCALGPLPYPSCGSHQSCLLQCRSPVLQEVPISNTTRLLELSNHPRNYFRQASVPETRPEVLDGLPPASICLFLT